MARGDDSRHPRFKGCGPKRKIAPHAEPDQCDVVQIEFVQDGADGLLPSEIQRKTSHSPSRTLPRPLEPNHPITRGGKEPHQRVEFLDERIVSAVQHDSAARFLRTDDHGREPSVFVRYSKSLDGMVPKSLLEQLHEPLVQRPLVGIVGKGVELGGPDVKSRMHQAILVLGPVRLPDHLGLPVVKAPDSPAGLLQVLGPSVAERIRAVELEVVELPSVEGTVTDRKGELETVLCHRSSLERRPRRGEQSHPRHLGCQLTMQQCGTWHP